MEQNQQHKEYNSFSLILFLWKWKKALLIICLATAVLSFTFSTRFFIRPRFTSTAIVYAPRTNAISKILMNEQNYNERLDIKAYGIEEETEQMMQILKTRDIQDALIAKFNLIDYYEIDTAQNQWRSKLYKTVTSNVHIARTQYGAIAISVTDWSPERAADMANFISDQLDTVKSKIERERAGAAYLVLEKQCERIDEELTRVNDTMRKIMGMGVYDLERQSDRITQQMAIAVAQGNNVVLQRLQNEQEKLATWGPVLLHFQGLQFTLQKTQGLYTTRMLETRADMEAHIPAKFVIEKAAPPDKKSYPKKLMIMITSTVAAFFLAIFVLLIMENIRNAPELKLKRTKEEQ